MLSQALGAFLQMDVPEDAALTFIIVENDETPRCKSVIDEFAAQTSWPVRYDLEPQRGMPYARNRVLDMATAEGCVFLTFVDDDNLVTPGWLPRITGAIRGGDMDLVGGPIRFVGPQAPMSAINIAALNRQQYQQARRLKRRQRHVAAGTVHTTNVYTHNWCARMSTVQKYGLRFNESLAGEGGDDTQFSRDMASHGGRVGWVNDAEVLETLPLRRLSAGYLYRRARDQALMTVDLNNRKPWAEVRRAVPAMFEALALLVATPFLGARAIVTSAQKFGVFEGRLRAALGLRSAHYSARSDRYHTETSGS